MKRLLSVLLALTMLFGLAVLAACNSEEPEDSPTQAVTQDGQVSSVPSAEPTLNLDDTLPNEYVAEKLAAGKEVIIGRADAQLNDAFNQKRMEGYKAACEELGFTVATAVCDGDSVLQLEQVENFVQMGCALIVCTVHASEMYDGMSAQLEEQGIYLVIEGLTPEFHLSGAVNVDNVASGTACREMASAWVDEQYGDVAPGSIKAAVLMNTKTAETIKRTNELLAAGEHDDRIDIVYTQDDCNSLDGAFNAAESALTYDPDIKLFLCFTTTHALGVNNYVISMPDINYDEYGIVCTGVDPDVYALIDIAAQGGSESVIRGTIAQGMENTWDGSILVLKALLFEGTETPYVFWEPIWSETYLDYSADTRS